MSSAIGWAGVAVIGGVAAAGAGASIYGANKASAAAKQAASVQANSQKNAVVEQRRQFDAIQELLKPYVQAGRPDLTQPYVQAGPGALAGMQALAGLGGEQDRQRALYQLQQSPEFTQIGALSQKSAEDYQRQRDAALAAYQKSKDYTKVAVPKGGSKKDLQAELVAKFQSETDQGLRDIQAKAYNEQQGLLRPILEDQSYAKLGAQRQQEAIQGIEQGPLYQELAKQGENAMLQNASATGGLRGGNVQGALAQFRPALLNQLIESQYGKLAGLTTLGSTSAQNLLSGGQASAAQTGAFGQQSAQNIGNLMVGQGQAQAAGIIGSANAQAQGAMGISSALGSGVQNYMLMNALGGTGTGGWSAAQKTALAGQ
jgi:hypothetical protein